VGLNVDVSVVLEQIRDRSMINLPAVPHYTIQLWNFVNVLIHFGLKKSHVISCSSN